MKKKKKSINNKKTEYMHFINFQMTLFYKSKHHWILMVYHFVCIVVVVVNLYVLITLFYNV